MKGLLFCVFFTSMAVLPQAHSSQNNLPSDWNIPPTVWARFNQEKLIDHYEISTKLNPFYLRGDFDGDGVPDYAVLVTDRTTKVTGIAVVRSRAREVEILGAGGIELQKAPTADGSPSVLIDDFGWVQAWHVVRREHLKPTAWDKPLTQMIGEGVEVERPEASSALIYWDGHRYRWLQDSD